MNIPTECPVCGAYSLTQDDEASRLLAVCDVLTVKALELIGKRIVRENRARFLIWAATNQPISEAHTHPDWQLNDHEVTKALKGAWDVVPALMDRHAGCCETQSVEVMKMLDSYVHDLVITGHAHDIRELQYYFTSRLGLPVYLKEPCDA